MIWEDLFYGADVTDWRKSPRIAVGVTAAIIAIQLAIPLIRLVDESRTERFGWQMFSAAQLIPAFVVETADESIEIALADYMARPRADIDIERWLPPHLCRVLDEAVVVTWSDSEYRC